MKDILTVIALFIGACLVLLSAAGAVRMPDLFTRMQAISKASTLGLGSLAFSAALFFANPDAVVRAAAIVIFYYLTNPIAAHVIARAAYFVGGEIRWRGVVIDELEGRYNPNTHQLEGFDPSPR